MKPCLGKLSDVKTVLIDIGTGYFVEKNTTDAAAYIQKRIARLEQSMSTLQEQLLAKRKDLDAVTMVINRKVKAAFTEAPPFPSPFVLLPRLGVDEWARGGTARTLIASPPNKQTQPKGPSDAGRGRRAAGS